MSVAVDEETFWLGDWRVEPPLNRIVRGEEIVRIDPRNMKVLQLLASRPGQVFSQPEIEQAVWADVIVTPNSVYQSIAQLRRALIDERGNPKYIETIPRRGYRAVADVSPVLHKRFDTPRTAEPICAPIDPPLNRRPRVRAAASLVTATSIVTVVIALQRPHLFERETNDPAPYNPVELAPKEAGPHEHFVDSGKASARLLQDLGYTFFVQGNWPGARKYFSEALALERIRVGDRHPAVARLLTELSTIAVWSYDYEAAEAYAHEALAALDDMPAAHPERIVAVRQLGYILLESGRYSESETHLLDALKMSRQAFRDTEWNTTAVLLLDLAMLRYAQENFAEAEGLARQALKLLHQMFDDETRIGNSSILLGKILLAQGRYLEAKREAEDTLALLHSLFAEDHPYIIAARDLLALSLIGLEEYLAAEDILRRNVDLWRKTNGTSQRAAASLSALGEALLGQRRITEAEECLRLASVEIDGTSMAREEQQWYREHKERLEKLRLTRAELSGNATQLTAANES